MKKNIVKSPGPNNKPKVLVSGLGPVGGFFVVYLSLKYPDAYDITAYEPNLGDFSRRQILVLQPDIWSLMKDTFAPGPFTDPNEFSLPAGIVEKYDTPEIIKRMIDAGCYVHNPAKDPDAKCYKTITKDRFLSIRTRDLEFIFYDYITKHLPNVKLIRSKLPKLEGNNRDRNADPFSQAPPMDLSKFDYIISASGGRDHLGDLIGNVYTEEALSNGLVITFVPVFSESQTKRDLAEEQRKDTHKARRIFKKETPEYSAHIQTLLPQHRYRGFKSKDKNFYLGVQLGKKELDDLWKFIEEHGEITYYNMPKNLEAILKNTFLKYEIFDIDPDTLRIGFFPIIKQSANTPAGIYGQKGTMVFLIGDSLASTHFFSGMGVNGGIRMAAVLVNLMEPAKYSKEQIVKDYTNVAEDIKAVLSKASDNVTVDMDTIDELCNKHTKKEIYELAWANKLIPEGMSKREVCLSLGNIMKTAK